MNRPPPVSRAQIGRHNKKRHEDAVFDTEHENRIAHLPLRPLMNVCGHGGQVESLTIPTHEQLKKGRKPMHLNERDKFICDVLEILDREAGDYYRHTRYCADGTFVAMQRTLGHQIKIEITSQSGQHETTIVKTTIGQGTDQSLHK